MPPMPNHSTQAKIVGPSWGVLETVNDQDQSDSILDRICIAMPCSIGWDNMKGNDEVRLCGGCNKNVYNISAMSKKRAEQILQETERPCVRLYRNADGSIVSDECPNWLKPIRRTWKKCIGLAVSVLAVLISPQNAKAEPGATARDQNMIQTEPTVIDGRPYGGIGRPERKKTPSAVPTFRITDGVPIDPRHHKVRIGSKEWRDYYVKTSWPASINRIGIIKDDLPNLDSASAERIFGFNYTKITLQPIAENQLPPSVNSDAWKSLESARQVQAEACAHFAQNRMEQCKSYCLAALNSYDTTLEQIDKGSHDPGFRQFVQSERSKIEVLQQQSDAYLKR